MKVEGGNKKNSRLSNRLFLAVWTGLEPATPCVTGRYSNQLNYRSKYGGRYKTRTCDIHLVRVALYQLS